MVDDAAVCRCSLLCLNLFAACPHRDNPMITKEKFKENMRIIRLQLKAATGTRATLLCMAIAATRGHVHCQHVWQRLDYWRDKGAAVGTLIGQRVFLANGFEPDPWGKCALSTEETVMILHTVAAADAYRAEWALAAANAKQRAEDPIPAI